MKRILNPITQEILDNLKVMPSTDGAVQMFNVQKNPAGDLFVEMIRKALHRGSYKIRVRGSLSDRKSLRKKGEYVSDESVRLDQADRYRIYIEDGGIHGGDHWWERQYEKMKGKFNSLDRIRAERETEIIELRAEITKLNQYIYDLSVKEKKKSKPESMLLKITDKASFMALQRIAFKYNVGWISSGLNIVDKDYGYVNIKPNEEGKYIMVQYFKGDIGDNVVHMSEYCLTDLVEFLERVIS